MEHPGLLIGYIVLLLLLFLDISVMLISDWETTVMTVRVFWDTLRLKVASLTKRIRRFAQHPLDI